MFAFIVFVAWWKGSMYYLYGWVHDMYSFGMFTICILLVTRTLHFWDDRCSTFFSVFLPFSFCFTCNNATSFKVISFDWDKYLMKSRSRSSETDTDRTWRQYCSSLKCLHDISHFMLSFWDTITACCISPEVLFTNRATVLCLFVNFI